MMDGFLEQRQAGKSIKEISELYNLSKFTIYHNLQEIANRNGVTRESLLYTPQKSHGGNFAKEREKVNPEEIEEMIESLISESDELLTLLNDNIEEN